jgi:VCBS repeat-containing protein
VSITVTAVNDAPVAVNDGPYSVAEDAVLTIAGTGVLANDTDAEGTPLTAVVSAAPAHGTVTLNANGSFTYTPAANYNGPDTFTYTASDGSASSNVATVTITVTAVNDVPVAANDSYTTNEDTALIVPTPGVLANDSRCRNGDADCCSRAGLPRTGHSTLNANGSFTYTPASNYNGADSFTYRANDGTPTRTLRP